MLEKIAGLGLGTFGSKFCPFHNTCVSTHPLCIHMQQMIPVWYVFLMAGCICSGCFLFHSKFTHFHNPH